MAKYFLDEIPNTFQTNNIKNDSFFDINRLLRPNIQVKTYIQPQPVETTNKYTVVKGDSPWAIAKRHGISLAELYNYNPGLKGGHIYPGDKLNLEPEYETRMINLKQEQAFEDNLGSDNVKVIQSAPHSSNYAIIDKKNHTIRVFDKDNNLLYETQNMSSGKSGDDFNTVTYAGQKGELENYAGNNSTPAGITKITSIGDYHGSPSFQRARFNPDTGKVNQVRGWKKDKSGNWYESDELVDDNVASAIHFGNTKGVKNSNGCIRVGKDALTEMAKYLGVGDDIYTLPEKAGSRFTLKGGKLNFTADSPYGITEKGHMSESGHDMVNWDDYNTHIDKSSSPLIIKPKGNGDRIHDENQLDFANTLSTNKEKLQKQLNLTSDEYNRIAQLAMGLGEQESKFGTSKSYNLKNAVYYDQYGNRIEMGDALQNIGQFTRSILRGNFRQAFSPEANSKGITQIKYDADIKNKELKQLYDSYGITKKSLDTPQAAAIATMLRLGFIYRNEVKGGSFKDSKGKKMNPYDALLYKYNGRHKILASGKATPSQNLYIANIKKYGLSNDYFEERKYRK